MTARKTNVEYEGQQINQQRTTLANQSANYYNDLLGMSVPTPPSVDNYTKTVYSFEDGALTNQITALIASKDGNYKVSYLQQYQDDFTPVSNGQAIISSNSYDVSETTLRTYVGGTMNCIDNDNEIYELKDKDGNLIDTNLKLSYENGTHLYNADNSIKYYWSVSSQNVFCMVAYQATNEDGDVIMDAVPQDYIETDAAGNEKCTLYMVGSTSLRTLGRAVLFGSDEQKNDPYLSTLTKEQLEKLQQEEESYLKLLNEKYSNGENKSWLVRYVKNTSTGEYSPVFYNKDVVANAIYDANGTSQSNIPCYKIGSATKSTEVKGVEAKVEKDSTGRYINITLNPNTPNEVTYSLTTSTITDQQAYDDAMNQYEFDKYQYDQAIQEINAKIEIVQAEDKNLELRLKQLDTEQNAISTEIDAVSKVIEKNTESSFKTFG